MVNQELIQASPSEGYNIVHKVLDDAIALYVPNGGSAVARMHVDILANELLKLYNAKDAYQKALDKLHQIEMAEQQQAYERNLQQQRDLVMTLMDAMKPESQAKQPASTKNKEPEALPPKLSTPRAMLMWQCLQKAGYIDEYYQPIGLSRTDVALLAEEMTIRLADENDNLLDIKEWKPYETLWHRSNMKADHQHALNQNKTSEFRKKLQELFKDI